jgi:hypothetical protein
LVGVRFRELIRGELVGKSNFVLRVGGSCRFEVDDGEDVVELGDEIDDSDERGAERIARTSWSW